LGEGGLAGGCGARPPRELVRGPTSVWRWDVGPGFDEPPATKQAGRPRRSCGARLMRSVWNDGAQTERAIAAWPKRRGQTHRRAGRWRSGKRHSAGGRCRALLEAGYRKTRAALGLGRPVRGSVPAHRHPQDAQRAAFHRGFTLCVPDARRDDRDPSAVSAAGKSKEFLEQRGTPGGRGTSTRRSPRTP